MRYNHPLDGVFFSKTATRLLRVLSRYPQKTYTGRELSAAAGTPHHRAAEALRRLEKEGVVTSKVVGNAYIWQVRAGNPLIRAMGQMFRAEGKARAELESLVRKNLGQGAGIEEVTVFGSGARGEERPGSDFDLLVIVSTAAARGRAERALMKLRLDAWEAYGTRVRPIVYSKSEFARKRDLPLVKNIEREGIRIELREGVR